MITTDKVYELASEKIKDGDNFIVEISVKKGNKITVLIDNDKAITINDCVEMSKFLESKLDREADDFELSVMSAGLTEPFKVARQYQKNIGRQVEVITKEGQKYVGKLLSIIDDYIAIETIKKEKKQVKSVRIENINLKLNQIKETKRVISF
ncbi:MAG: ribosome assembly cofactor RimP [Bacteroidota bacterium]